MGRWVARQRYLIDYSLSSLLRRKGKTAALALTYTGLVFLLASVMLFSHALKREAAVLLQEAPEVVVQRLVAGRHDLLTPDFLDGMGRIRGVRRKVARLWGYFYDPVVAANYTFLVPHGQALQAGTVAIGHGVARARGAGVGDVLSFRAYGGELFPFEVAEVLSHESAILSADLVLVSESDFRAFFGIPPGYFTDIALWVSNPREVRKVAEKIALAVSESRPILREEILRTYEAIFSWREGLVLILLVGTLLAFVILAFDKASGLSAEERREIGVLKAVGWETGDIIRMKFWEGFLVSLSAALVGYLLAYCHVFLGDFALFEPVLKGWAVLYPGYQLTPFVDGLQVATLLFLTVFPYAAATVLPVWRTAVTDPDAIMRET